MARKKQDLSEEQVSAVVRAHARRWTELPNVTSVGVGYQVRRGVPTDAISIQVSVSKKFSPEELQENKLEPLPKFVMAPGGRRIPVDVIERSYRTSHVLVTQPSGSAPPQPPVSAKLKRRRRLARVMPGISVGHPNTMAGTIGAIVYDRRTGRPCILSNAHVLQGSGGQVGDNVVQPGRFDDGDVANNVLGTMLRSHFGLAGDCAIAGLETRLYDEAILELGVAPKRLAKVSIGDRVIKSGRTTGVTRGIVIRTGIVINHNYGGMVGVQQIAAFEVGPAPDAPDSFVLCDEGDSGSLWLIEDGMGITDIAAGLHFAQQSDATNHGEHALACNIHSVFEKLDISFIAVT
jgi:endonuclease G